MQAEQRQQARDEQQVVDTEVDDFDCIDKLGECGTVGAADIAKLKTAGIFTVQGIRMRTRKSLTEIKGLSEAKVDKILEAAAKTMGTGSGFVTGVVFAEKRKHVIKITTGSRAVDTLLGGGIETKSITEAFGEFRCGKTQLSHTLCVSCQLPLSNGGGAGKAIFIDTEGTFRPERIRSIAERFGLDPQACLENILVARAYTHEHQIQLLSGIASLMVEDVYRLIVVDSATALFRVDFSGRGELAERQQKLGAFLSGLIKLSDEFNVAVWITNQVVATPDAAMSFGDNKKPIGGNIMAHASTTRLYLRKGRGEQRICKIYDSPTVAENEAVFAIAEQGIVDATD